MTSNNLKFTPALGRKRLFWVLFAITLGVGLFARFIDLSHHFTNTDDLGIIEITFEGQKNGDVFYIPRTMTNAPLQYLPTYFMLSEDMAYGQLLFWGRLPSCLLGCGALLILLLFYLEFARGNESKAFLGLTLAACSWEAIIFSKQTHSYSIGVFAAALLTLVFLIEMRSNTNKRLSPLALGITLAFIGSMQYQILVFFPAFFISLFFYRHHHTSLITLIKKYITSSLVFGILFFPIWKFFLSAKSNTFHKTLNWTLGPNLEFSFPTLSSKNFIESIVELSNFYLKNFYYIFESKISFMPYGSPLATLVVVILFLFFCLGAFNFFITKNRKAQHLGLFFGLVILTWWILVPLKHFPYSPSRHTLILLPFICITITEGFDSIRQILKRIASLKIATLTHYINIFSGLLIMVLFLFYYPHFLKERKSPISEKEVCAIIEKHSVDAILFDRRSLHLEYMGCVRDLSDYKNRPAEIRTFATISKYPGVTAQERCEAYKKISDAEAREQFKATGTLPVTMKHRCSDYKMIYKKEVDTGVMEGFNPKLDADIYGNRLFFYIISLDE